jgi:hypothetical protein
MGERGLGKICARCVVTMQLEAAASNAAHRFAST